MLDNFLCAHNAISGHMFEQIPHSLKYLELSRNKLSGTLGVLSAALELNAILVTTLKRMFFLSHSLSRQVNDMALSGSLPSYTSGFAETRTFSATRNFLVGTTDALDNATKLEVQFACAAFRLSCVVQTLIISSNRFSCSIAEMSGASGLADGKFYDPTMLAEFSAGRYTLLLWVTQPD